MLINGQCGRKFRIKIGVCQGDPLSPYLLIIVSDIVQQIIRKAYDSSYNNQLPIATMGDQRTTKVNTSTTKDLYSLFSDRMFKNKQTTRALLLKMIAEGMQLWACRSAKLKPQINARATKLSAS
jgi:hypothetical protein